MNAALTAVWESGTVSSNLERGLDVPMLKRKVDCQDCSKYGVDTLSSVPGKVYAHLLLMRVRGQL